MARRLSAAHRRPVAAACTAALLGGLAGPAAAQLDLPGSWRLQPYASVDETITDNARIGSSGGKSADAITRLSGGATLRGQSARLQGFVDYTLSALVHARHRQDDDLQHKLNANLSAELVEKRLTLDAGATVSQRALSVFGIGADDSELNNANSAETLNLRLAPTLRGQLGGLVNYTARAGWSATRVAGQSALGSDTVNAALLISPVRRSLLTWGAEASTSSGKFNTGRRTDSTRLVGSLGYSLVDLDLQLSARLGAERSNLTSLDQRWFTTWGLGAVWAPSPRTRLDGSLDKRPFGHAHRLRGEYRTPRTVWSLSAVRDVGNGSGLTLPGALGPAGDLLMLLYQSVEPDPLKRLALVVDLANRRGIDLFQPLDPGFLTGAVSRTDRLEAQAAWRHVRDTVVVSLSRSQSRRVDPLSTLVDDLADGASVRTHQVSVTYGRDLSPHTSLSAGLKLSQASGGSADQDSRQLRLNVQLSTRLSPEISAGLGARHNRYDLSTGQKTETALTANLAARF